MRTIVAIGLILLCLNLILGGVATQYDIQFWASYFKGTQVHVSFMLCFFLGIFLGEFTIPIWLLTLIFAPIFL